MGQATSTQVQTGSGRIEEDDTLTNAQLGHNIESLFKSPHSTRIDSVRIDRTDRAMDTSPVEVDTIVNQLKGGNRSRVSVIPARQRYKVTPKSVISKVGGASTGGFNLNSEDIRFVRDMVYQNRRGGALEDDQGQDVDSSRDLSASPEPQSVFRPASSNDAQGDLGGLDSATSPFDPLSATSQDDPTLSASSPFDREDEEGQEQEDEQEQEELEEDDDDQNTNINTTTVEYNEVPLASKIQDVSPSTIKQSQDNSNPAVVAIPVPDVPKESPKAQMSVASVEQTPSVVQDLPKMENPSPVVSSEQVFVSNLVGGQSSLDKDIKMIRRLIDNTVRQRGGNTNGEQQTQTQVSKENMEELLSEDGLADIRESLAKNGVIKRTQNGGGDNDLKIFRDNILNQSAETYSNTSPDPSNFLEEMAGGSKKKASKDDEDDEDLEEDDDDDGEDDDDDVEKDEDDDDDNDDEEEEDLGEEEDGVATSSQEGGDGLKDDDSSSSDDDSSSSSNSSGSSSSSSSSDSEISRGAITIMHNAINKTMERKQNNSKYLKNNGYKVTSNSDRDYKINNKMMYSSQSSDVHSSVGGSDYLNSMRNRDRFM
ncbi:hypothetical protein YASMINEVIRUS_469 [Yasminevirus sp. GU-2018]|uniref:Uncharacterized protein n=1 Tax=Yasminevirus sp. GU-2018 TaxID=2420051 RepID=A0A5K0UA84_9VIRU|nr:hypothetical protein YASMINEVIRUS_469 [Yasminevirus sp. GU-2018]